MYHRVIRGGLKEQLVQDGMYVNVETFEQHVRYLKENYNIVSLETLRDLIGNAKSFKNNKPFISITFDDGWKDFYDNAFPVLLENKIYATVFLPTEYIGTKKAFWVDRLGVVMLESNHGRPVSGKIASGGPVIKEIMNMPGTLMERFENAISILKNYSDKEIEAVVDELTEIAGVDDTKDGRAFLSWEEVKIMNETGYIQFGSHTQNHVILTNVPQEVVRRELVNSRKKLCEERVVSESFVPFTYPNGNHTDDIQNMVEETGYSMALTTNNGLNYLRDEDLDIFRLKRIGIHQDMSSTRSMFACRIHGIY